ncbi:CHASE2 domain-containing protein [Synechococcus sp. CCY 9618]|uniref:CHASE2 domain-containing protein n=1 Tax=Synechococcus sp. CCY 9618 TaxID=2815602 RepID=UPI001C24994B|nr:adenylate/guanylate cyclase domain-containing protein [Synechococcus sp. CCY 9618]
MANGPARASPPKSVRDRLRLGRLADGARSLVPYGAAALLLLALQRSPINETLNLLLYDLITSLRAAPPGTDRPITIVGIDESDLATYGFPIDDKVLCEAIDRLDAGGAVAIGLDIYRDQGVGPDQGCLRERFRSNPRLVSIFNVAEAIGAVPGTPPERRGFNDLVVDPDGIMRRDLVHVAGQDEATVSLPLRLLEVGTGQRNLRQRLDRGTEPGPWLEPESGGYEALDAAGFQQMLSFHRLGSFHLWSLQDVLGRRPIPSDQIRGHIVLIGSTAPSLRDLFSVPQTRSSLGARQRLVPGVEIHAHRLAALMERDRASDPRRLRTLPGWLERTAEVLAVVLGLLLGEAFLLLRRSVIVVGLVAGLMVGGAVALLHNFVWVGLSMPLIGLITMAGAAWLRRGASSQKQRQQIERLLGQTTSPAVARQLWNQRDGLLSDGRFEGRLLPVTVLMSDTCQFTSVSERLSPGELLAWLNRGMALFVPAITRRGGMVNKFTGDGLLAVFGAPLSSGLEADAKAAVDAALAIQRDVARLNQELEQEGLPAMGLRIGVHSGAVLAGSMGSTERLEYAVIGDAVNCASRLESLQKERQTNLCRVLVSSSTRDLLPAGLPLEWLDWGSIAVKGRAERLRIWELRGSLRRDSAPESALATGP